MSSYQSASSNALVSSNPQQSYEELRLLLALYSQLHDIKIELDVLTQCMESFERFFVQTNLINKEEEKAEEKEEEKEEEGYLLTPTSRLLLKNEPLSLVPFVQVQLAPMMMDPWQCLGKWFKNGEHSSSTTPFGAVHGKPFFEYSVDEPRFNRLFNEAMSCDAPLVTSVITEYCKGAFEGLKSLVDIGGGTGTLAKAIADTFPQISCTVFDLPQVIEGCEGSKNITYVSGDMFKFNPSVDVIFLKGILHDWSDEDCIKILKKCEEAIPIKENGGRVIIIDMVLMGQKGDHNAYETTFHGCAHDGSPFWKGKKSTRMGKTLF
ncbi:Tabersonine 16-O-methyltransferase [Capsicum baccatum]|uniref:Tabersonine 16-O-methyltransferase n=1 Tax=Capsicum baccatum TaxID=33114 RepID=A0A2G2VLC0_CAPBA|nr:Tabersonine 16-O-methyltransferase [Capsicum baccatum]